MLIQPQELQIALLRSQNRFNLRGIIGQSLALNVIVPLRRMLTRLFRVDCGAT